MLDKHTRGSQAGSKPASQLIGFMWLKNFDLIIFGSVCAPNIKILACSE
jgi:hypothetical protein